MLLLALMLLPVAAQAISGHYTDAGGGTYWCNVYVSSVSDGKSYGWCTGDSETAKMNEFRGFESEHDGKLSLTDPTIQIKFRYHKTQSKDFDYDGSSQDIYLMTRDGVLHRIANWGRRASSWQQIDDTYGLVGDVKMENDYFSFRYVPNGRGVAEVVAIQIENETYYHQDNLFTDYYFQIHARYLKDLSMDFAKCQQASVEWTEPGRVTLSANGGWLPATIGNKVDNFTYKSDYRATVLADGKSYVSDTFGFTNKGEGTLNLDVPLGQDFAVEVVKNTTISYQYKGRDFVINFNENEKMVTDFNNTPPVLRASFNQVAGEMRLQWDVDDDVAKEGEYQIYRTTMNEYGSYIGNREKLSTSSSNYFTDNAEYGLDYNKRYRYEVFQLKNSWGPIEIPTNPNPLTVVKASTVETNTIPVIPMHLTQDAGVTDKIKIDWTFGNVPQNETSVTFDVARINPDGTVNTRYGQVTVPRGKGEASFIDDKPESSCEVYNYYVTADMLDGKLHFTSDTLQSSLLDGSIVTSVTISKGNYEGSVHVNWTAKQVGLSPTYYEVHRRFIGTSDWSTIGTTSGTTTNYTFIDQTAEPGRFYEYRVAAYTPDCDGTGRVISNSMIESGFSQATGVVAGRVHFDTGTAVEGVRLNLLRSGDESARPQFYSRAMLESGGGMEWHTDAKTANSTLRIDKPFTLQMWVNPKEDQQWVGLFKIDNYDTYSHDAEGHVTGYSFYLFNYDHTTAAPGGDKDGFIPSIKFSGLDKWFINPETNLPAILEYDKYTHLTIRNNGNGSMTCIINGEVDKPYIFDANNYSTVQVNYTDIPADEDGVVKVKFCSPYGNHTNTLKGNIDEVRVWSRALPDGEIVTNYDRLLSGREQGLKVYWTFDEGLEEYAFDNSYTDGVPNGNHPILGRNTRPSEIVPSEDQLSLYGITNTNGEYIIRGIPFTGSGTGYTVAPSKGTHKFNPTSRTGFISASSLSLNGYDFTDESSFNVRGTIRYSGTDVPVDSVTFYVDGLPCSNNGNLIMSDANGEYLISVPIGEHYIEARRNGHTFEAAGRFPETAGETYNFVEDDHIDFFDNTLVNFSGRITGGQIEGEKPLGYGVSRNNIGQATITLGMLDHPQRRINVVRNYSGTTMSLEDNPDKVDIASASTDINSRSWRGYGDADEVKNIYIVTDSVTGEFSAMLPPLRYNVKSVNFNTNVPLNEIQPFGSVPAINLTNPLDSVRPDTLWNDDHKTYAKLYRPNKALRLIYRSNPVFDVTQVGAIAGAFGTDTVMLGDDKDIPLPLYSVNESTGAVTYNYGYPMFQQHREYDFKIKVYEPYTNYDTGPEGVLTRAALADSVISINNELSGDAKVVVEDINNDSIHVNRGDLVQLESNQLRLDSIGEVVYKWSAGFPNLNAPYTRTMNMSVAVNGRSFNWKTNSLEGIILGVIPTGNNFITAGPTKIDMVLRDPPGSQSTMTWEVDTIKTKYSYRLNGFHNADKLTVTYQGGCKITTILGILPVAAENDVEFINEETGGFSYELKHDWDDRSYTTYTNSHTVTTGTAASFVGRNGDVFIGYSTNYIIGAADKVGLFQQDDGSWKLGNERCMSVGESFGTHFEYPQSYIEKTLIPNIEETRNSKLKHVASMSDMEENPAVPTYYTLLDKDDPRFGSSNGNEEIWGDQAQPGFNGPSYWLRVPDGYNGCDSVEWQNENIRLWRERLADNEEDKIKAFNDPSKKLGNESFTYGAVVSKTTATDKFTSDNHTFTFSCSLAWTAKIGLTVNKHGVVLKNSLSGGYHYTEGEVDEKHYKSRYTYTFNDAAKGTAHTVDIYESTRGWSPIFRTRAGQTRCPYEPETRTKYYNPGMLLDFATMKMDNPKISIPERNITDVPAGQTAQLRINLTNESETHDEYNVVYLTVDPSSNPDGLQVMLDGYPLAETNEIWIPYGQTMERTLTLKQSNPAVLDYRNIKLDLKSTCQSNNVFDSQTFTVQFVAAAPNITLMLDKNIVNKKAHDNNEDIHVTIKDVNRQFTGLKGVRLKYRFAGDSQWITAHEWMTSSDYLPNGENDLQSLMPAEGNIYYTLVLPDIDGNYIVAAESMALFGNTEVVNTTPEQTVIRDTRGPKLLGQAYPNTGILTPTDDIYIKFNEAIRESYLTKDQNFFITGSLNDAQVSHDVSLQFNGQPVETDAYLPINNTSFASSLWLKRKSGGTIIEHGTEGNSLSVKLDDQGYVTVDMAGETIRSEYAVPADKWVFLAMNYVKGSIGTQNTLTMLMDTDGEEKMLFDEANVPDYNANGRLTLGRGFTGMMHELVLWNKNCPVRTLLAQKDEAVAPYLPGLVGYWKMNEGHGTIVTDYARSRNFHLPAESWNVENTNLAAHLDGERSIRIPIASISPRSTDSYVVETWFRGERDKNARATLLSVTNQLSIGFDYDNSMILHLYNDTLSSLETNGLPIVLTSENYNDGNWHHLAINVHRGVSAVVYLDGKAVKTLAEQQLPPPAGDYLYVGSILKRNAQTQMLEEGYHFTGDIDELRVWNVACDGTSVIEGRYNQVDTADVAGLIVYLPMERSVLDASGHINTEFSLDNKAPLGISYGVTGAIGDGVTQAATAPALRSAPLKQNLDFDFTASDNEIYITLNTLPSRMQGNLLTFVVKNVRDMQDNLSETITWSAYVDYNTLEWKQDALQVEKDRLSEALVTAQLHNRGRESERFALSGLPTWIIPSVDEGVLSIDESMPITFTIGPDAPVGTHALYAYAVNDDDISTPLLLSIHVKGNDPQWTVDPDSYESSMNIIGQIYYGDKICTNTKTKIAAFVDGECRGVASPKLVTSRDAYFVNLTVYGLEDVTALPPVSFRIYDAEQGVVLSDVITYLDGTPLDLSYRPNDLIGDFDTPVKWMAGSQIEQMCNLKTGWNWISLYAEPEAGQASLESVFGHSKVFNTIKSKEGFAMNSGTKWTYEGLDTVAVGKLYKIKVKQDIIYNIVGHRINTQETYQTIYKGWNWIGPLSIYNLSLSEAFADLAPTRGDIIKSKNQVAFYDGYKWEGDLVAVIPGMGYYYKSNNPDTVLFRYPTVDDSYVFAAPPMMMRAPAHYSPFEPVDHHQFSDNMNVVARVMVDEMQVDTLTIGAFIGDECRGVTTATEDGYYLFTIAGNAEETGQNVTFATVIDGQIVKINEQLPWVSDIIYGDLDEPVLLTVGSSGVIDIQALESSITITPTLVRDVINVRSDALLQSVAVYSSTGSMVQRLSHVNENAVSINLGHVAAGVYFVEATTLDGNRVVKQIIKQ